MPRTHSPATKRAEERRIRRGEKKRDESSSYQSIFGVSQSMISAAFAEGDAARKFLTKPAVADRVFGRKSSDAAKRTRLKAFAKAQSRFHARAKKAIARSNPNKGADWIEKEFRRLNGQFYYRLARSHFAGEPAGYPFRSAEPEKIRREVLKEMVDKDTSPGMKRRHAALERRSRPGKR